MFEFLYDVKPLFKEQMITNKNSQVSFGKNMYLRYFDKETSSNSVSSLSTIPKKLPDDQLTKKFRKSPKGSVRAGK